jgi:hypothetical protein
MNLSISIELGNDRMRFAGDVVEALQRHLVPAVAGSVLALGDQGTIMDVNGNTVGRWAVVDTRSTPRSYAGDQALRDATPGELSEEPDGVLQSLVDGDLDATEQTRHLAQAELDYRRERR